MSVSTATKATKGKGRWGIRNDLTGKTFGRLTALSYERKPNNRNTYWHCECVCGKHVVVTLTQLTHKGTKSCGCLRSETSKANAVKRRRFEYPLKQSSESKLLSSAKMRAKNNSLDFDLELSDIVIPENCPVLGIKLEHGKRGFPEPNSPTIDRIDNNLGYTKNNIWVISFKANAMKSSASLIELKMLVSALEKKIKEC